VQEVITFFSHGIVEGEKMGNGKDVGDVGGKAQPTQFLAKVASLLEVLSTREELTSTEIAELLGEPRSSVYRLLKNLADVGWIDAGSSKGSWRLGLHLFRMSSAAVQRLDERKIARPHMERLNQVTEQTVFLCIRRDWEAVCIDRIEGLRVANLALRLGGSLPLHVGAAPQTLLAYSEPAVWDQWKSLAQDSILDTATANGKRSTATVLRNLSDICERGYAISDGDVTPGIAAVGVPVFDHTGSICAAVSVSGLRESVLGSDPSDLRSEVISATVAAGRAISHSLGYRDPAATENIIPLK
jgi:DNA-binding IclR family transcriptional regulator